MTRMAGEAFRAPSALPGWTRAHVLTHLARNADAMVNLLTWARTRFTARNIGEYTVSCNIVVSPHLCRNVLPATRQLHTVSNHHAQKVFTAFQL